MFGPLSRSGTPARRLRRRVAVIAAVAIVVAVILGEVIDLVVNSQQQVTTRSDQSFIAATETVVVSSNALLPLISAIRNAPGSVSSRPNPREALNVLLDELSTSAAKARTAFNNIGLVAPSPRAEHLFEGVLTDRLNASLALSGAVALATATHSNAALSHAAQLLRGVGTDLSTSDTLYRQFVRSLPRNAHAKMLSASRLGRANDWSLSAVRAWANALSSSATLAAHSSIRIVAISLEPPAVRISGLPDPSPTGVSTTSTSTTTTTTTLAFSSSSSSSSTVLTVPTTTSTTTTTLSFGTSTTNQIPPRVSVSNLPATKTITVTCVVANGGNVALSNIAVGASLAPLGHTKVTGTATSVTEHVRSITAGGARYLSVGRLTVTPGASYVLTVRASAGGVSAQDSITLSIG